MNFKKRRASEFSFSNFTHDERRIIMLHYEFKLKALSQSLKASKNVFGTSIIFMKRFYVHRDILEFHPDFVWCVCFMLACKAEEARIRFKSIAAQSNLNLEDVLSNEINVLEGINFHLWVYHPYRSFFAFMTELKVFKFLLSIIN